MHEAMRKQLARSLNLRDFGGIPVQGGGEVRRRTVYRSGTLAKLCGDELVAVRALEIRSITDLRYNSERAVHPTPWREMGCSDYWFRDHQPLGGGDLNETLKDQALTQDSARNLMLRLYRKLPYTLVDGLKRLFQTIGTGEGAFLVQCSAGKDRTGVAAALVLAALGAPHDAIVADYMASAEFDLLGSPALRRAEPLSPHQLEVFRPVYSAHGDYLDAMFDAIVERDGSVEGFLRQTLGLTAVELDAFRRRLLA